MKLEEELAREHSKTQTELIVAWVGERQNRFDQVVKIVQRDDEVMARRAAWALSECVEQHPPFAATHLASLVEMLSDRNLHNAIRRHIAKILQVVPMPVELCGSIFDICFSSINDPNETIAIQAYSMTTLRRICEKHPELVDEVALAINEQMPYRSAAFQARGKRTLRELAKIAKRNEI